MARKRMISPSIWASSSFSKLSNLAKIVFIGLFSNADDDGKGYADATLVRSTLFPRDGDKMRITDIEKALSEIALNMSIIFYEVKGEKYYYLTKWSEYQKIDRPTPSKIPNPPATMGERGRNTQNQNFDEGSTSIRRGLDEGSSPNIIEDNKNRIEYTHNNARARTCDEDISEDFEQRLNAFCQKWDISIDCYSSFMAELNFEELDKRFSESLNYLADKEIAPWAHTMSGILARYKSIMSDKYKTKAKGTTQSSRGGGSKGIIDSWQALHDMFAEENKDDT